MSRWLKSVNNLLETLDGTAETVAEGGIVGGGDAGDDDGGGTGYVSGNSRNAFGQLLETGRQAVLTNATRMGINSNDDDGGEEDNDGYDELTTDDDADDELYDEEDADDEDAEEEVVEEVVEEAATLTSAAVSGEALLLESEDEGLFKPSTHHRLAALQAYPNPTEPAVGNADEAEQDEEAMSLEGRRLSESVSDLSFSEADLGGEDDDDDDGGPPGRHVAEQISNVAEDGPIVSTTTPPFASSITGTTPSVTRTLGSPKVDQSPRQPLRSTESGAALKGTLPILLDVSFHHDLEPASARVDTEGLDPYPTDTRCGPNQSRRSSLASKTIEDKSAPPRLPQRQSSRRQEDLPNDGASDSNREKIAKTRLSPIEASTGASHHVRNSPDPNENQQGSCQSLPPLNSQETAKLPARQKQQHQVRVQPQQQGQEQGQAAAKKTAESLQLRLADAQTNVAATVAQNSKLLQRVSSLEAKLRTTEAEVEAQAKELDRAGQELAQIRTKTKEELDEVMDEHDEELDEIQKEHQSALDTMRHEYERTIAEWKEQYDLEQAKRQMESGDWTKELEEAIQREKEALKRLHEVSTERTDLQIKHEELASQYESLQRELGSERLASQAATERERQAHNELDEAINLHSKQISQRQRREAELEQTVLELGGALTMAQQQRDQNSLQVPGTLSSSSSRLRFSDEGTQPETDGLSLKEKWEQVSEELETIRVQLAMELQRRETLERELQDIAKERTEEASLIQMQQHQHDQKVADLESTVLRLQSNLRIFEKGGSAPNKIWEQELNGNSPVQNVVSHELEEAKREIRELSEQLLRHQSLAENAKSEILALKGRLQTATIRAEDAEKSLFSQSQNAMSSRTNKNGRIQDVESGDGGIGTQGLAIRRRVKGGHRAQQGVRSIRSALHLGSLRGGNPALEQVIITVDAIDSWMVDTGSFMRHEPLARFGFLLYLVTLHVYCTVLVLFHTTEIEHGDFGSLDSNPRHWRAHA